jgi:hypothetical protein
LIGTCARSKLAAPQTTPMSAGQPPRGVQPESQKHCAESPPHKSGWLTPFHTLPLLNLCSADTDLHSQAYFARLPSLPTQDDKFCTRHVGERGQRYRTHFVRICLCEACPACYIAQGCVCAQHAPQLRAFMLPDRQGIVQTPL